MRLSAARRPAPQTLRSVNVPAPTGGVNTVEAAARMPATDCIYCYNLIGAEQGLRSRLGYQEWCTNLTGASDNRVRSILPFNGSHKNGSTNKLFATTTSGIWDVSASSAAPTLSIAFGTTTGDAGLGTCCVMSTPAGRFLLYCDEENGLYIYSENSTTWSKVASGVTHVWTANTAYAVGNKVVNGGKVYTCVTAGVSAASGGPTGVGAGIADGTAAWDYVSASSASVIGPSLADQNLGYTGDPANFAFVCTWKSRVWLVEKDTSRAWYLGVNSIYGTATSFDFGGKMRAGGPLVGLYDWSYDGGNGLDSLLVGISGAGDVVIYQGTDPSSASTFGLKGSWFVGGVPAGRRIATDYGGDILVLSLLGVVPLSKLVIGNPIIDRSQYVTAKVSNLFNVAASTYKGVNTWALHLHPTDNALLVLVPTTADQPTTQLAYSFATKGWSQYRDLPMMSAGVWAGQLYFGTADGRVAINTGYVDNVLLSNANSWSPVAWSVLTGFTNLGAATQKRVQMVRPTVLSQSPSPTVQATAKYGFDLTEPAPPSGAGAADTSGLWDGAVWDWDRSVWGGDYSATQTLGGAVGMGRDVALAVRGTAIARTVLVGVDVYFDSGGLL